MPKPITVLRKKAKAGNLGLPKATLAFYGPDDKRATKAVLGVFLTEDEEDSTIHRFTNEEKDVRFDVVTQQKILARLREHEIRTLVMVEKIFGCSHEEAIDYPEGESCPMCSFWQGRDRFEALD